MIDRRSWVYFVIVMLMMAVAFNMPTWDEWSTEKLAQGGYYFALLAHLRLMFDGRRSSK